MAEARTDGLKIGRFGRLQVHGISGEKDAARTAFQRARELVPKMQSSTG